MIELDVPSEEAQEALGRCLAACCPRPFVVVLAGDLGAGKTTLVRGFLRGLGHVGSVKSPTFTLIEPYDVASGPVFHLDLYRLADPEELEYLGLRDLLGERSLLLVEWPDRGAGSLPPADLRIDIEHRDSGRRLRLDAVSARGREAVRSAVDAFSSIRCQETGLSTGNS
jgi:tRNA threonylcarbamoyladenosine biosynthesis protein TsaE